LIEINGYISGFGYNSVKEIKETYGNSANQIIAECIAECDWDTIDNLDFNTEDEALEYIEQEIIYCQIG
jgi:hypothetical protein